MSGGLRRDATPRARRRSSLAPLAACGRDDAARYEGGWLGAAHERGHRVRDGWPKTKSGASARGGAGT